MKAEWRELAELAKQDLASGRRVRACVDVVPAAGAPGVLLAWAAIVCELGLQDQVGVRARKLSRGLTAIVVESQAPGGK